MKLRPWLLSLLVLSTPVLADSNIFELEDVLRSELESAPLAKGVSKFNTQAKDQEGTTTTNKATSIREMLSTLGSCKEQAMIASDKQTSEDMTTISFACRREGNEIISAEVLIQEENGTSKVVSYQEMVMEERPMTPAQMTNMVLNYDMNQLDSHRSVSPGVRTLFTLAKVGVPVYLSFKLAKVLSPVRTDWQKHFIAGAIISGVTVLTAEGLIRAIAKRNGYHPTNLQMNLMTSFAGLLGSMAAGVSKELYDKYSGKGHPEVADAVYTAAGGASVAFTVAIPIEAIFRTRRAQPRPLR
jgi:hypothetical protein